jgi:hypothetical protein
LGRTDEKAALYRASPSMLIVEPPHRHPYPSQMTPAFTSMQSESTLHDVS